MSINKEQLGWLVYKLTYAQPLTCKDPEITENVVLVSAMSNYDKSKVLVF